MTKLSGKTVLVTGCNGFIGMYLTRALRGKGARVIGIDKNVMGADSSMPDIFILGDLTIPFSLLKVKELEQDVVCIFHLAAQADVQISSEDPYTDSKDNILGTIVALEIARLYGCPFVYAASGGTIYGRDGHEEGQDLSDLAPYALSKKVGEDYVKLFHEQDLVRYMSLRLANVYGHGGHGVLERWCKLSLEGKPIELFGGDQTRDFVYIDDVVDAFVSAGEMLQDEDMESATLDIASGTSTSMTALASLFTDLYPTQLLCSEQPGGEVMQHFMNPDGAARCLGWEPTTRLPRGIRLTYEEYREEQEEANGQD